MLYIVFFYVFPRTKAISLPCLVKKKENSCNYTFLRENPISCRGFFFVVHSKWKRSRNEVGPPTWKAMYGGLRWVKVFETKIKLFLTIFIPSLDFHTLLALTHALSLVSFVFFILNEILVLSSHKCWEISFSHFNK